MFETALRAAAARGVDEHQVRSPSCGHIFSGGVGQPLRLGHALDAGDSYPGTDEPHDRSLPPKSMNSNNDVDQAAAVILCSVERARSLGVPRDRWVFPLAGADGHDDLVSVRADLTAPPPSESSPVSGATTWPASASATSTSSTSTRASPLPYRSGRPHSACGSTASSPPHRWPLVRRRPLEQLRHARHRDDGRGPPGPAGCQDWCGAAVVSSTKHSLSIGAAGRRTRFRRDDRRARSTPITCRGSSRLPRPRGQRRSRYTVMHDRDEAGPRWASPPCLLPDGRRAWGTSTDRDLRQR